MKTASKMTIVLTALALGASTMLGAPAFADSHTQNNDAAQTTEGTTTMDAKPTENMATAVVFLTYDMNAQLTADEIVGMKVEGTGGETIGDVNQVVLSTDGEALGIIVGVGGFLGIGEKDVAVSFDRVQFMEDEGMAKRKIVLTATKEELEAAPAYERNS